MNKITMYKLIEEDSRVNVEPASKKREWMESSNRFAYRCLPLVIANQHGWVFSLQDKVYAQWDGSDNVESVKVRSTSVLAKSHFGQGILTFNIDRLISLPEGYSLYITGPPNHPKEGIYPLTGVYEADWAPYSFTMNWKFTEAGTIVVFEENEPFCFVFPIRRNLIESFVVETKSLNDNPELKKQYKDWARERQSFNNKQGRKSEDWQKHYAKGEYPNGTKCPYDHMTKIKLE
jgi:hypothetical protein